MKKCKKCKDGKSIYVMFFEKDNPKPVGIHIWNKMKMIGSFVFKELSNHKALKPLYYCLSCHSLIQRKNHKGVGRSQRFEHR